MFDIINPQSSRPIILLAEHAGAEIPKDLENLGFPPDMFGQDPQMFFDPGSREMAEGIGRELGITTYCGKFSRLVVDLNREEDSPDLIKKVFHGREVPLNQCLSDWQRRERIEKYYLPFHEALRADLARRCDAVVKPILVSIHSFNFEVAMATFPDIVPEKVDVALLYDEESDLVSKFRKAMDGKE